MSESLAEQARVAAAAACDKVNPLDLFRDDMLRAAHKGLFSCKVDLNPTYGNVGFFLGPDTQAYIGDALAEHGIRVSFGDPVHVGGFPSCKLDWYSTRKVNKWSRVVRQEKSAQHYQNVGVGVTAPSLAQVVAEEDENVASEVGAVETSNGGAKRRSKQYEEKVVKSNTSFDSESVANAIRQRREEENRKSPHPSREEIRRATNEKAAQAVQARLK